MANLTLRQVLLWIAGIVIVVSVFASGNRSGGTTPVAAADTSWVPAGFTVWSGDADVAYQWRTVMRCGSSGTCVAAINAVSRTGCPSSLYAEVSLSDSTGTAIGYTNDLLGAVRAGQQASLTFETYKSGVAQMSLTKINCY